MTSAGTEVGVRCSSCALACSTNIRTSASISSGRSRRGGIVSEIPFSLNHRNSARSRNIDVRVVASTTGSGGGGADETRHLRPRSGHRRPTSALRLAGKRSRARKRHGTRVALARGTRIELEDLPEEVRQALPKANVAAGAVRALEDVEKDYILAALEVNAGNQTRTAEQLRIGSATLYRKLKSYGVVRGKRAP
jgi:hypothetical protein